MQSIARKWLGKNASPGKTLSLATAINTAISLFDSLSDIAVAIQLFQQGDWTWGLTVLLIDNLPMWQVLLHGITSNAWKEMEDTKERWITCLILLFAPFSFPILQIYWLLSMRTAKKGKGTLNFLHQNSKVAELLSGTLESPLQFIFTMILYAYGKLPLPWSESTIISDSVGNKLNLGALPGIISVVFSVLTMIKNCADLAEAQTTKDKVSYAAFCFSTIVFRLSSYILLVITFREMSAPIFGLIAIATLSIIARFDWAMTRGLSLFTTFMVGLIIPSAVSEEPHKTQLKGQSTAPAEVTRTRYRLTSRIVMWTNPIIMFFNGLLCVLCNYTNYKVSSDLLMNEDYSKSCITTLVVLLVIPSGICSFIGAILLKVKKHHLIATVVLVAMAVLTLTSSVGSIFHVFEGKFNFFLGNVLRNNGCLRFPRIQNILNSMYHPFLLQA